MAHIDDQGAKVHAARAHEGAFPAQHAFAKFVGEFVVLSATEGVVHFPDVEVRELPSRAGGRAAAAPDAQTV